MSKNTGGKIMKTIKKLIVFLLVVCFFMFMPSFNKANVGVVDVLAGGTSDVDLSSHAYTSSNPFALADVPWNLGCTRYAWGRAYERLGIQLPVRGRAKTWYDTLASYNYEVGSEPKVNSIAVWTGGENGHVAFVEAIDSNGVHISEGGYTPGTGTWGGNQFCNYTVINHSSMKVGSVKPDDSSLRLLGYVYLTDVRIKGYLDSCEGRNGGVAVSGWALDYDNLGESLDMHIYIGGPAETYGNSATERKVIKANAKRSDVNEAFAGVGEYHGYDATVETSLSGQQPVYVYAVNGATGKNIFISSATVDISSATTPQSITLNKTTATLTSKGATTTLTATVSPSTAVDKSVTWKSSNTSVATVSSSGVVTAVANGTATITATTNTGAKTASCTVTVSIPTPNADGWYYVSSLPSGVTTDKYEIQYQNTYIKYATSSPGTGYSDTGVDKTTYVKSGDPWETATNVTTSNTVRLLSYYYYHYCTDGVHADYKRGTTFIHYDSVSADLVTEYAVYTDKDDGNYKYYHLKWKDGTDAYCNSSNRGCDGSDGAHGNRSYYWYKMSTYQNYTESLLNEYKKVGSWTTSKDSDATSVSYRYRLKATGVSLDKTSATLSSVGATVQLKATVSPSDATEKSVTWKSSNTSVATVSSSGLVTAVGNGSATITVTTVSGGKTATCAVTVSVATTGVSLNKTSATLTTVGGTVQLTATVSPSTAANKSVTWKSSNTSVATVSSSGLVTAVGNGTATITVTTASGGKTATCTVTVNSSVVPTGVSLDKTSMTLTQSGETSRLTATVSPSNATDKTVKWTSSDTSVATVSSTGVVKAVGNGTATITVTTVSGSKTATCKVTVELKNGFCKALSGTWCYFVNGKVDTSYTGMAKNEYGWWYVKNGVLDKTYTGLAMNDYGTWYMKDGKLDSSINGLNKVDGKWLYFTNGKVNTTYTGLGTNDYGTWYMKDGRIDTTATGLYKADGKWLYFVNGKLNETYTGLGTNDYGTWYVKDGRIDTTLTGLYKVDGKWLYFSKGKLNETYTGPGTNEYGTWYLKDGRIDTSFTGLGTSENGTWYVKNGKIYTTLTGLYKISGKWLYFVNGKLNETYTGLGTNDYGTWYMKDGRIDTTVTGLYKADGKWLYFVNGKLNETYTGIATNDYGTWYMKDGRIDTSFSGKVTIGGKTYTIKNGKVV